MRQTKKGLTDYYTESEDDAYGYLRDIVRRHGGRMWHDKKGNPHGAWKVRLNGQTTEFKGTGMGNLPDLDKILRAEEAQSENMEGLQGRARAWCGGVVPERLD